MTGFASSLASAIPSVPASAQFQPSKPVAIVEDVKAAEAGVGVFDYLEAGHLIRLSAGEKLVLGYLASCLRETIHGGVVTIGDRRSAVTGGLVIREQVECDGGAAELSVAEASQSGAITFRQGSKPAERGTRSHPITVFSSEPVFMFSREASELVIRRLDRVESDLRLPVRRSWLAISDHDVLLGAGGLYEARAGRAKLVFRIVSHAGAGGPLLGRVVRF